VTRSKRHTTLAGEDHCCSHNCSARSPQLSEQKQILKKIKITREQVKKGKE
jgi:hypothetical protein